MLSLESKFVHGKAPGLLDRSDEEFPVYVIIFRIKDLLRTGANVLKCTVYIDYIIYLM